MEYSDDTMTPSSDRGSNFNKVYEKEDYCRIAAERFREVWESRKTFHPDSLRHYGLRSDRPLIDFFDDARLQVGSLGMFALGFTPEVECASVLGNGNVGEKALQQGENEVIWKETCALLGLKGSKTKSTSPGFCPALPTLDPIISKSFARRDKALQLAIEGPESVRDEFVHLWNVLQGSPNWGKKICGVVTVPHWRTPALRARIREQLQLASFLGLFAVEIPLPVLWDEEALSCGAAAQVPDAADPQSRCDFAARNWTLLGHAADEILSFMQSSNGGKVWIRCDASNLEHLLQFQRLHYLVLYGYERDAVSQAVTGPRQGVTADNATELVHREAITNLKALLYFFSVPDSVPTAWLGEDIAVFEPPSAEELYKLLYPFQKGPTAKDDAASPARSSDRCLELSGSAKEYSFGVASSSGKPSESACSNEESGKNEEKPSCGKGWPLWCHVDPGAVQQPSRTTAPVPPWKDLLPRDTARWGGLYPSRISLISFIIELMRRQAAPIFSESFFDHYAIMNWLYAKDVIDPTRGPFVGYEDTLQLPLQPLSQPLPNIVYHIFECDFTKYKRYRDAIALFFRDWSCREPALFHHSCLNSSYLSSIPTRPDSNSESGPSLTAKTVYIVLLGCGRGGLIDEILAAASAEGLRACVFAIEKNGPAADLAQLRWLCDREWRHQAAAFGHRLELIVSDGRCLLQEPGKYGRGLSLSQLPDEFGICDLLVSEMLGSFGDNELSPECIDAFHKELLSVQAAKGILPNKNLVSIPQSYTTSVAPLHSTRLEECVLENAVRGLSVRSKQSTNRHTGVFSSPMVSNIVRGVLTAPPQVCWTFSHIFHSKTESGGASARADVMPDEKNVAQQSPYQRSCLLHFRTPAHTRCSGMAGFFTCVLYRSEVEGKEVCLGTEPRSRTPGMYSWFPGYLPLDPSYPLQTLESENAVSVVFHFERHLDEREERVWYSWGVEKEPREWPGALKDGPSAGDLSCRKTSRVRYFNEGGWAASVSL